MSAVPAAHSGNSRHTPTRGGWLGTTRKSQAVGISGSSLSPAPRHQVTRQGCGWAWSALNRGDAVSFTQGTARLCRSRGHTVCWGWWPDRWSGCYTRQGCPSTPVSGTIGMPSDSSSFPTQTAIQADSGAGAGSSGPKSFSSRSLAAWDMRAWRGPQGGRPRQANSGLEWQADQSLPKCV